MPTPEIDTTPRPGQVWLSRPPFLMLARVRSVEATAEPAVVSYDLHDSDGTLLETVDGVMLAGWWRAFRPLEPRFG